MNREITLGTKLVGNITGDFYVPSYQRGYRWGKPEVERLLDDIYSTKGDINYCLQPVVVKKNDDGYELIDGQQRLTTIYLIYRFMSEHSKSINGSRFTLSYETRKKSKDFLKSIDESRKEENIDFWFFCTAYESIKAWFSKEDIESRLTDMNDYFKKIVKIIWYEVGETEDAIGLFTRLNIGKIPLTNAELVKAMFLSKGRSGTNMEQKKQEEISLQWDNIEKELHNDSLWFFLTNKTSTEYQTRADLVLDLISQKPADNRDKYYTFFKFNEMYQDSQNGRNLDDIWYEIQQTFLTLKEWHSNHEFYHKIGYLIASGSKTLREIFERSKGKTKSAFKKFLDEGIKNSIKIGKNYADLNYENTEDQKKIKKLLLLFNVESVRKSGEHSQRFPFDKYKNGENGKVIWSLEHIHAQQSEGLSTQKMWKEWLRLHKPSVESSVESAKSSSYDTNKLIKEIDDAINNDRLSRQDFDSIQQEIVGLLSEEGHSEYLHSIANLALLSFEANAALSNSTFDVKRNEIIKMDKEGAFIPFCTRMVFLKYYTPSAKNQLHFWGKDDRDAYVNEMNIVLGTYLEEKILLEKGTK